MRQSNFRLLRIIISILFFIPTTYILIDFYGLVPGNVKKWILFLQFTPSVLNFITIGTLSIAGFIIVLALTFLFGRVYCSSVCPLGVLQDIINYFSKKIKKRKKKFIYVKENKLLRYSLLALTIIPIFFGINTFLVLLDPYSLYGRIAGNFALPILAFSNNGVAYILEQFNNYSVYPHDIQKFSIVPFAIVFSFFGLIAYLSFKHGRLYCNTICPVGTLLGIISKYSLFKIRIKEEECLSCGACARDCKAECIDSRTKIIDTSRCIACFDCIPSCPTEGITFSLKSSASSNDDSINNSKRNFLTKTSIYLLSLSAIGASVQKKIKITKPSTIPVFKENAVSPPGSFSLDKFNGKCTACHLCVTACPTQVLQPSFLEYGFTGMLQPHLDNSAGYCNFDCTICSDVCPTGAIIPITRNDKHLAQIGIAKFIKENCVVHTQKTDCGACSEHCPTKAVHMIPYEVKGLVIPEVREEYCIGCGACEFACPTIPYKSIYIEGNSIHKTAKKNVEEKKLEKVNMDEDFPF